MVVFVGNEFHRLLSLNDMRAQVEYCDLVLRSERGSTSVKVYSLVMTALSPYIDSALAERNDRIHTGSVQFLKAL